MSFACIFKEDFKHRCNPEMEFQETKYLQQPCELMNLIATALELQIRKNI